MYKINTAVRRGRPTAANDNSEAYAERASTVRAMRQEGLTFRDIADRLALDARTVRRSVTPTPAQRPPLAANDNKVIQDVPFNGGWSTNSGLTKVSLPRVPTLERRAIALDAIEERMAA